MDLVTGRSEIPGSYVQNTCVFPQATLKVSACTFSAPCRLGQDRLSQARFAQTRFAQARFAQARLAQARLTQVSFAQAGLDAKLAQAR